MNFLKNKNEVIKIGTNFYMMTTNKELVKKHFSNEYEIVDEPYLGYEIHIGKRSAGWKPLFEEHKHAYDSVEGLLKFLENNRDDIRIFNEYREEFDINGLKEKLIMWADRQKKRKLKYENGWLTEDENGEIDSPIDHVEYSKIDPCSYLNIKYWHDKDGYDFTDRSFS